MIHFSLKYFCVCLGNLYSFTKFTIYIFRICLTPLTPGVKRSYILKNPAVFTCSFNQVYMTFFVHQALKSYSLPNTISVFVTCSMTIKKRIKDLKLV